jgi:hypothetical protein
MPTDDRQGVDSAKAQDRTRRDLDTREVAARPKPWAPVSMLPDPDPQHGWDFRWIRTSLTNDADNRNVSKRLREGWEPCKLEDHPELSLVMSDHESEWAKKGAIEVGGLLLCKISSEAIDSRREYFSRMAAGQMDAVDNRLASANSPGTHGMAIHRPERSSRTTFGSGE